MHHSGPDTKRLISEYFINVVSDRHQKARTFAQIPAIIGILAVACPPQRPYFDPWDTLPQRRAMFISCFPFVYGPL
jgi:hypothetical protein